MVYKESTNLNGDNAFIETYCYFIGVFKFAEYNTPCTFYPLSPASSSRRVMIASLKVENLDPTLGEQLRRAVERFKTCTFWCA
jgi:hypothetical protein